MTNSIMFQTYSDKINWHHLLVTKKIYDMLQISMCRPSYKYRWTRW